MHKTPLQQHRTLMPRTTEDACLQPQPDQITALHQNIATLRASGESQCMSGKAPKADRTTTLFHRTCSYPAHLMLPGPAAQEDSQMLAE